MYCGIAGLIGAGKTTFAARCERLGWSVFYEPVDENPYLAQFYKDPSSVAFKMELYLLGERMKSHLQAVEKSRDLNVIEDRTSYEDVIFVNLLERSGVLLPAEADIYRSLAENVFKILPKHTLIYYLRVSSEKCLEQVRQRDRDCETGLTLEYLQSLHQEYERYLPVLKSYTRVIEITPEQLECLLVDGSVGDGEAVFGPSVGPLGSRK